MRSLSPALSAKSSGLPPSLEAVRSNIFPSLSIPVLSPMAAAVEYRCFVGGLSWNTSDRDLEDAFRPFGEVIDSKVIVDRETSKSRGFGFVTFANEQSMRDAIECMNGKELDGRNITVNQAQSRSSGGGGSGGGGYRSSGGGGGGGGYGGGSRYDDRGYASRSYGGGYGSRERSDRGYGGVRGAGGANGAGGGYGAGGRYGNGGGNSDQGSWRN